MDNNTIEKSPNISKEQIATFIDAFLLYQEGKNRNEEKNDRFNFELEKQRIEAERQTEKWNKIVGGSFTLFGLLTYAVLMWFGKMTEGFGILITAVITASLSGTFKNLIGEKKVEHKSDLEE